jgi:hypothetical protein
MQGTGSIWFIVTCMGRLAFVKQTVPTIIGELSGQLARAARPAIYYCLVDFSCPDASGAWLEKEYPNLVEAGRVRVVRAPGQMFFHKTVALNLGARAALAAGADALCFVDADTSLRPEAFERIFALAGRGRFLVVDRAPGGASVPSLTGLLAVSAEDFRRAGGYAEAFEDWGSEDLEMRLRLHLRYGLEPVFLPPALFSALAHGNWLRSRFHRERDIARSAVRNYAELARLVRQWTGAELEALGDADVGESSEIVRRLLFDSGPGRQRRV